MSDKDVFHCEENDDEVIYYDGLKEAFIGLGHQQFKGPYAVYDREKAIEIIARDIYSEKKKDYNFDDMDEADQQALIDEMKAINGFKTKQFFAYKKNRIPIETRNKEFAEKTRQKELQKKIEAEAAKGKSMSQIGRENFTGEGMAFQAGKTDQGGGVTKGKVQKSSSVPGGYYGSPRKDGGLINGYDDGGMVYLYDRQEMADGGETESYEDIIDAYENGVGVLKGESLTDYIRRNRIKLMNPMDDLEKALFGKANGGPISESDFPFLINRPGENTGRKKPGLSDYDKDTQDYDYYDDDPIITIPMGKMMKKKSKKKKKKKDRKDYSDGGRVYLYDRQD